MKTLSRAFMMIALASMALFASFQATAADDQSNHRVLIGASVMPKASAGYVQVVNNSDVDIYVRVLSADIDHASQWFLVMPDQPIFFQLHKYTKGAVVDFYYADQPDYPPYHKFVYKGETWYVPDVEHVYDSKSGPVNRAYA